MWLTHSGGTRWKTPHWKFSKFFGKYSHWIEQNFEILTFNFTRAIFFKQKWWLVWKILCVAKKMNFGSTYVFWLKKWNLAQNWILARKFISSSKYDLWLNKWLLAKKMFFGSKIPFWLENCFLARKLIFGSKIDLWLRILSQKCFFYF